MTPCWGSKYGLFVHCDALPLWSGSIRFNEWMNCNEWIQGAGRREYIVNLHYFSTTLSKKAVVPSTCKMVHHSQFSTCLFQSLIGDVCCPPVPLASLEVGRYNWYQDTLQLPEIEHWVASVIPASVLSPVTVCSVKRQTTNHPVMICSKALVRNVPK